MGAMIVRVFMTAVMICYVQGNSSFAQENTKGSGKSLYERLGGIHAISVVVDDFVERIWENEVLNANPKNKKAMGIDKPALKYLVTELMGEVTGGPQKYTGKPLKPVHSKLNISEEEWDAMAAEFKVTLDKYNVPEKEQQELFEIVGASKGDIVMSAGN